MKRIHIRITGMPDAVSSIGFEASGDGLTLILPDEADVEIKSLDAVKRDRSSNVVDFPKGR